VSGFIKEQEQGIKMTLKGFLICTLNVGSLPPVTAESFTQKAFATLKEKMPDDWKLVIVPSRELPTKIEVFTLNESEIKHVEPFVLEATQLVRSLNSTSKDDVRKHALIFLGEPVTKINNEVLEILEEVIEEAFYFDVNDKKAYVNHRMSDLIGDEDE
jgi:hypothetical protein